MASASALRASAAGAAAGRVHDPPMASAADAAGGGRGRGPAPGVPSLFRVKAGAFSWGPTAYYTIILLYAAGVNVITVYLLPILV